MDAFLLAMLDAPDDATPRCVLTDWLEERDQSDLARCLRSNCDLIVEPRGRGVFVGFAFPDGAEQDVRHCPGYAELTAQLAHLEMRRRLAA